MHKFVPIFIPHLFVVPLSLEHLLFFFVLHFFPPFFSFYRLDSVVTVVDADALLHQLESGRENAQGGGMMVSSKRQLDSADVVLLNKADLISPQGYGATP